MIMWYATWLFIGVAVINGFNSLYKFVYNGDKHIKLASLIVLICAPFVIWYYIEILHLVGG